MTILNGYPFFFTCQHANSNNSLIIYLLIVFKVAFLHVLFHLVIFQTLKQARQNAITLCLQMRELGLKDVKGFD